MGNDLQKQYNLKQKPIRLPGSYQFLKFVDHPTDPTSSLIIIKSPHKAGIINSQILLPIKDIKNIGYSSDFSIATCKKCKPLGLVRPRSQPEMKLIIREIIKLGCEMGRIFLCDGRLMIWCEEIRSAWLRSPEEIENNKQTEKSKVFVAGMCLVNFLHCVYLKQPKKKPQKNPQIQAFLDPKDKKQYYQFFQNTEYKLSRSSFWSSISQGMKNLILVMLCRQPNDRIDLKTLMLLPYFATEKQLRLYHMLSDEMLEWDEKECIILMETIEMVIHDRIIFDDLVLNDYLAPILVFLLEKRPEVIISAVVELPNPPTKHIVSAIKKASPKNVRLFNAILLKIQKYHTILDQQQYDAALSRTAFCSFELEILLEKLLRVLPFLIKTIKEPNYRKQLEFQLLTNILENKNVDKNVLLLGLKCVIGLVNEGLISSMAKLYGLVYNPHKMQLQTNLHILELYRLMIDHIEPHQLLPLMMPKLEPYLSSEQVTNQLFLNAKHCLELITSKLMKNRQLSKEDEFDINYDPGLFRLVPVQRPAQADVVAVLRKEAMKSKNGDIVWLAEILDKQQPLAQL